MHRRRVGALSSVTVFEQAVLKHPLAAPGFLLDGLEFVEEVGPFDDTLFACFEAVGSVEGGGGGGGTSGGLRLASEPRTRSGEVGERACA